MLGNRSLLGGMLVKSIFILAGMAEVCQSARPEAARPSQSATKLCADSSRTRADSSATPRAIMVSVLQRLKPRYDAGYRAAPIHPYFRDEQRVINDMRRLVIFVDKNVVSGFESVPELAEIARKLPAHKQTAIIRLAVAGSVVNLAVENAKKYLRRRKLSFVQLETDRVRVSASFKGIFASSSRNIETQTYTLSLPRLRTTYSYLAHPKLTSHSLAFSPLPRLGLGYTRWDEFDIFNVSYAMSGGYSVISHDYTRKMTVCGLRLQKNKNWLGLFYVMDRRLAAADWLRLDCRLVW
jgi:hypothetical protein